jgi:hypothetical protein
VQSDTPLVTYQYRDGHEEEVEAGYQESALQYEEK